MALTDNLVSYYKCDDNGSFPDAVGSYNGTINGATYTASGKINGGYDWDGTNDTVTASPGSLSAPNNYSISLWFNADSLANGQRLIEKNSSTSWSYVIQFTGGNLDVNFTAGATQYNAATAVSGLSTGTWYHVVGTFESSDNVKLYVDTSLTTGDATGASGLDSDTFKLYMGSGGSGADAATAYYNGKIDEIGIRDKTLTAAEVSELYNSGSGLQYPFGETSFVPKVSFIM